MSMTQNNSAKYAYFYLLSLVSLSFMAISVGMVVFQIINKYVFDVFAANNSCYSSETLKFAISAIIISSPIYFYLARLINKSVKSGLIERDSGIRKWLTYLILFVSSVVVIGNLIAVLNSFFNGELTLKFGLKALTILIISLIIFSYYLLDIKNTEAANKGKAVKIYLYFSLLGVLLSFIFGIMLIGSPAQARKERMDQKILERTSSVKSGIQNFYDRKGRLPKDLAELVEDSQMVKSEDIIHPAENKNFDYKIIDDKKYEICGIFYTASKSQNECFGPYGAYGWGAKEWEHEEGYQCLKGEVYGNEKIKY